jgi:hypothetical protein
MFLVFMNMPPVPLKVKIMETAEISETLVNFHQTERPYNPEHRRLHTHRREDLKFHHFTTAQGNSNKH